MITISNWNIEWHADIQLGHRPSRTNFLAGRFALSEISKESSSTRATRALQGEILKFYLWTLELCSGYKLTWSHVRFLTFLLNNICPCICNFIYRKSNRSKPLSNYIVKVNACWKGKTPFKLNYTRRTTKGNTMTGRPLQYGIDRSDFTLH